MIWPIFFVLALLTFVAALVFAFTLHKSSTRKGMILTPTNVTFAGVLISAIFIFIPIYGSSNSGTGPFGTFLLSVHNMLRIFVIDGELSFVSNGLSACPDGLRIPYFILAALLFVAAPMLTFGFLLSLFKNFNAIKKYVLKFFRPMYLFSDLNERSIVLAESVFSEECKKCVENDGSKKPLLVFAGCSKESEQKLIDRANAIGAACFDKDISAIRLNFHNKKAPVKIFVIGEDESDNVDTAYELFEAYKDRPDTDLYFFSAEPKSEALVAHGKPGRICIRRINEARSFIYHMLYSNGFRLIYESASMLESTKRISAVVIGMNSFGFEMARALPWFCQMEGYHVEIRVFDSGKNALDRFRARCPELLDEEHNGNFSKADEAQYLLEVTGDCDYQAASFYEALGAAADATFVFIDTGDDALNTRLAFDLRVQFKRLGVTPNICSMLDNPNESKMLEGVTDYKGNEYDISFVGDITKRFSAKAVIASELEEEGLLLHYKWIKAETEEGKIKGKQSFYTYEYNYMQSISRVIHDSVKKRCKLPGIELEPDKREPIDRDRLRTIEHRRWNAYTRAEGFIYSGSHDPATRDDLAKKHNCLLPYDQVAELYKCNDD